MKRRAARLNVIHLCRSTNQHGASGNALPWTAKTPNREGGGAFDASNGGPYQSTTCRGRKNMVLPTSRANAHQFTINSSAWKLVISPHPHHLDLPHPPPEDPDHHEKHDEEVDEVDRRGGQHVGHQGQPRVEAEHDEEPRQAEQAAGHGARIPAPPLQRNQG